MPLSAADLAHRFATRLELLPSARWIRAIECWEESDETARAAATQALLAALSGARLHGAAILLTHTVEAQVVEHWSLAGYRGPELIELADRAVTVASQAAFAILTRDAIGPAHFAVLYAPFAETVPVGELEFRIAGPRREERESK